ncbi:MAG: TetR/AcrR family transcriptional regulator [Polyangiaceae bacterium]
MSSVSEPSAGPSLKDAIPLRERKFARTKMALLDATLERLKHKSLAEITVRELCDAAEVSEATFFNYFKKKDDLLRYFIQVWTLEVQLDADQRAGRDAGVAYIEAIFAHTAERMRDNPRVMLEIIGHMALCSEAPEDCSHPTLTLAERVQRFPDLADAAVVADECEVDTMFRTAVERAVTRKELPESVNVDLVVGMLLSVFFGTPLWQGHVDMERIADLYAAQLATVWAGLRSAR